MTLKEKVEEALAQVRPALEAHGGNVSLVDVLEDGTVERWSWRVPARAARCRR